MLMFGYLGLEIGQTDLLGTPNLPDGILFRGEQNVICPVIPANVLITHILNIIGIFN